MIVERATDRKPQLVDGHVSLYYQNAHFDIIFREVDGSYFLIDRYNSHQKDVEKISDVCRLGQDDTQ